MHKKYKIKPAISNDSVLIADVVRESHREVAVRFGLTQENCPRHPSNCDTDWIEAEIAKGVQYFLLEVAGRVCGCVGIEQPDDERCYLERLSVLPAYRHRGYGTALVRHILTEAKKRNLQRVEIGIIAKDVILKQWYQTLGFIERQTREFEHLPFTVMFMSNTLCEK